MWYTHTFLLISPVELAMLQLFERLVFYKAKIYKPRWLEKYLEICLRNSTISYIFSSVGIYYPQANVERAVLHECPMKCISLITSPHEPLQHASYKVYSAWFPGMPLALNSDPFACFGYNLNVFDILGIRIGSYRHARVSTVYYSTKIATAISLPGAPANEFPCILLHELLLRPATNARASLVIRHTSAGEALPVLQ